MIRFRRAWRKWDETVRTGGGGDLMSQLSLLAFPLDKIHGTDLCWDNGAAAHHTGSRRLPPFMQVVQRKHTSGGN